MYRGELGYEWRGRGKYKKKKGKKIRKN